MPGKAIDRVVRDAHGVIVIVIGDRNEHGAEDFLASHPHLGRDVGEQCREVERASVESLRASPAADDPCALIKSGLHIALDAIALSEIDEWPHRRALDRGWAWRDAAKEFADGGDGLFVARPRDQDAGRERTALPADERRAERSRHGRAADVVEIVEQDHCRLASKFQEHLGHMLGGRSHDGLAGCGGAGEGDHVDSWILGEECANGGVGGGDHVEDARWDVGVLGDETTER